MWILSLKTSTFFKPSFLKFFKVIIFFVKQPTWLVLIFSLFSSASFIHSQEIEEVVITGSLLKDTELDASPVEQISSEDFDKFNINNIAEISKFLNSSSGSRFQTNALEGVDQGMASITLRGLNQASTLLLINSKRHTFAGTPSNDGEGYIDANIIPEIAFQNIEILKEGATTAYGSDAVAGVVNFLTYKNFDGFKIKFGDQSAENNNNKEANFGLFIWYKNSWARCCLWFQPIKSLTFLSI